MPDVFDIYTIIFLALAVFIFLRLRSVLGQRTGRERPPYDPASARDAVLHVLDRGCGFYRNAKLPTNAFSETGRGLFLVEAMVDDLVVSPRPSGGSHVRAVLRRHAGPGLDATVDDLIAS